MPRHNTSGHQPVPVLYNMEDAARSLAISRSTLFKMVKAGDIAVTKIGHRSMISHETMLDFTRRNTRRAS